MNTTSPAVQKAVDFIKDQIDSHLLKSGDQLPSSRNLASIIGVSGKTMIKAIALLKAQKLIHGVQRGRLRVGLGAHGSIPTVSHETALWRRKRIELEKDILLGKYSSRGRLPSLKELENSYGVCFRTMRRILRAMADDGTIRIHKNSYVIAMNAGNKKSAQRIVFITYQIQEMPRSALNIGGYQVLALFERECMRRGIQFELVVIDFYNLLEIRRALASPAFGKTAEGYILDLWWYPGEDYRRMHIDLFKRLSSLKKPVAILDEIGTFDLPLPFASNPLFQAYRTEGIKAGSRVARFLLERGHRSVAYISQMHAFPYSRQRCQGITEEFAQAGVRDGVHEIVSENVNVEILHMLAIADFDESLARRVIGAYRTESQAEDQYQHIVRFRKEKIPQPISIQDEMTIKKDLSLLIEVAKQNPDKALFDRMCIDVLGEASRKFTAAVLSSLFESALNHKNITAWVCANDGVALAAVQFLKSRSIAIPERISVVGFDNEPIDAVEQRLTTFDFSAPGFINSMLQFIARPPQPRGPYRHEPIEIEGIVIQRDTTAPPGRK